MIDSLDIPVLFGRFLVIKGLLSEADIARASVVQRDLNATAFFVLIEQEILSIDEFSKTRAYQREHMVTFGEALRATGVLTEKDCLAALRLVDSQRMRLGEVLLQQGKLTREELDDALMRHRDRQSSVDGRTDRGTE